MPYYQMKKEGGGHVLTCHGTGGIYGSLLDAIVKKWPEKRPNDTSPARKRPPSTASKSAEVDGRIDRSGGTQRWSQISNGELRESLFCGVFGAIAGRGKGVPLSPPRHSSPLYPIVRIRRKNDE
jgi:hypothetical protein